MDKFNNVHFTNKLLICYGSLIVFAVLIVGFFSYYNIQNYIYDKTKDSLGQTLTQVKINIENNLNTYHELVSQVATDKSFVFALSDHYTSVDKYSYEYLNTISKVFEMKQKDDNIIDVIVYKDNDTLPDDGENLIDISYAHDTWWFHKYFSNVNEYSINSFIALSKQKIWIVTDEDLKPQYGSFGASKQDFRVAVIIPVIYNHEKLVGIVEVYIKYDRIFGEFFSQETDTADRIYISDQNRDIIFNSIDPNKEVNKVYNEAANKTGENTEGNFLMQYENGEYLVLFTNAERSGWQYFREIRVKNLMSSAKAVREFTVIIAVFSIMVSFVIGIALANMISQRISKLSQKMDQVDDLALDVDVRIDGNDEIASLARTYNRMIGKVRQLVQELRESQQIQREAEMKALQAQINPHFLYNTLATINWMAMDNENQKIINMVENLSVFYRLSLNKGRSFIRIEDEITQAKAYSDIQKIRLDDRARVHFEIEDRIRPYYIPKLVLQPFIENAVLHGAENKKAVINIIVRGAELQGMVVLEIIDDGVGMRYVLQPGEYPTSGGYGIRNVNEKIQLLYGNQYGVKMYSRLGIGTVARILLPVITEEP